MRNIVSNQTLNNFARIFGRPGSKGFLYRFIVYNTYFETPYNNLPELYFLFSFEPWNDGHSADAIIGDTSNHSYTVLISEAPYFLIMSMTY